MRELADRLMQRARLFAERRGWDRTLAEPTREELARLADCSESDLVAACVRASRTLAPGLAHPRATADALRDRFPENAEHGVRHARRVAEGSFDLLGYSGLQFDSPIDWRLDPVMGTSSGLAHWSLLPYLDPSAVGDHKVVWELSRHGHLVALAQAALLTGREEFIAVVASHLESWLDANPPGRGINWASSLEVGFRAIAWLHVLGLIGESLPVAVLNRVIGGLHRHARHIEHHLSTWFSPNTHLTGEALALVMIGQALSCLEPAEKWRRTGLNILRLEAERQLHVDGVYFEQSTYYQRYTLDFYLRLLLAEAGAGRAPDMWLTDTVSRCADFLVAMRRPDGTWPLIGDEDGGRLLSLAPRSTNDFRDSLALAGALLARPDYCSAAGGLTPENVWLLGPDARCDPDPAWAPARSRLFPVGGYAILQSNATKDWLLFEAGPHGALSGGHAHVDGLAIELAIGGRSVIADSGTGTYVADPALRDELRSGPAHASVTIDGHGAAVPGEAFRWKVRSDARFVSWQVDSAFVFAAGEQDGFRKQNLGGLHLREILWLEELRLWLMRDTLERLDAGHLMAHFPLATGLTADVIGNRVTVRDDGRAILGVWPLHSRGVTTSVRGARRSPCYGRVESSTSIDISRTDGQSLVTLLVAYPDELDEFILTESPDQGQLSVMLARQGRRAQVACHGDAWDVNGIAVAAASMEQR